MNKRYDVIEHTADTGVIAYGNTLEEMFSNAGVALSETILNLEQVSDTITQTIELHSNSLEDLFIDWLKELLYIFSVRDIIFKRFDFSLMTDSYLSVTAFGDIFDISKHDRRIEVKAITYHKLRVEYIKNRWEGEVIFDI